MSQKSAIAIKRAYDAPSQSDGCRVLVDRLWPRGVSKEDATIDLWPKAVAPSTELRQWYGHDPKKWDEFRRRYFEELDAHPDAVAEVEEQARKGRVTLVFSSKETRYNNAVALKEYLERKRK